VDQESAGLETQVERLNQVLKNLPAQLKEAMGGLPGGAGGQVLGDIKTTLHQQLLLQQRYAGQAGGEAAAHGAMFGQSLPQVRQEVLHQIAMTGGMPTEAATRAQAQMTGRGALSSLENLQVFAAQRMGGWIAGQPLYQAPEGAEGLQAGAEGPPAGGTTVRSVTAAATAETQQTAAANQAAQSAQESAAAPSDASAGTGAAVAAGDRLAALGARTGPRAGAPAAQTGLFQPGAGTRGRWGPIQQVGARVALSGGTAQGLLGALKKLPVIGLGVDIAEKAADVYQSQREAGRVYQEMEGGTNLDAQRERFHEAAYGLSMFGRMPEGAAAQAFGEVSAMGFNRAAYGQANQPQNRQSALNFIYHNYTGLGMDVNDSARVLDVASRNASVSLNSVSTAMTQLSKEAGQAGTNADQARRSFTGLLNQAIQMGAGPGAPVVAGAISSMQASYGRAFAGTSFAGELSANRQYMLAGQMGVTPAQLQYIERNQPAQYARALAGGNMQAITGYLQPAEMADLRQMINAAGGPQAIKNPDVANQVAREFLDKWQPLDPRMDENVISQNLSSMTGIRLSPNTIGQWLVNQVGGNNEAAHAAGLGSQGAAVHAAHPGGAPTGRYGLAVRGGTINTGPGGRGDVRAPSWQAVLQGGHAPMAAQAYLAREHRTGMRNPVLESLLQSGISGNDRVAIRTRTGTRVMSVAEAMKFYPNELAQGNVQFFDYQGKESKGTTASLTGGLTSPGTSTTAEEHQRIGSGLGVPMAAWRQHHQQAFQGPPGVRAQRVTVDLTQEARQILKLLPGVNDQAAAQASPAANPYVASPSR
jgi:hypothetical protein